MVSLYVTHASYVPVIGWTNRSKQQLASLTRIVSWTRGLSNIWTLMRSYSCHSTQVLAFASENRSVTYTPTFCCLHLFVFATQFAYNEMSFMLIRLLQNFSGMFLDPEAQPPESRPPSEWKTAKGRKAIEQIFPKSHLTMYSSVSWLDSRIDWSHLV